RPLRPDLAFHVGARPLQHGHGPRTVVVRAVPDLVLLIRVGLVVPEPARAGLALLPDVVVVLPDDDDLRFEHGVGAYRETEDVTGRAAAHLEAVEPGRGARVVLLPRRGEADLLEMSRDVTARLHVARESGVAPAVVVAGEHGEMRLE